MAYEIYECSPKAKERIETETDCYGVESETHHRVKYPFSALAIGQCFTVPLGDANEASLRNQASATSKRSGGKRFVVFKHSEPPVIEVARIR